MPCCANYSKPRHDQKARKLKAVMYHYVRPSSIDGCHFRYLHLDDFKAQLNYFSQNFNPISAVDFLRSVEQAILIKNSIVLTFDDGLDEHERYVLPALKKYKMWGIFYIPTGPYITGKLLDVHRIHVLIGQLGPAEVLMRLRNFITPDMLKADYVCQFNDIAYVRQTNDSATTEVKKILNYFLRRDCREEVLDHLMGGLCLDEREFVKKFYLTSLQIKNLVNAGMQIGSHGTSHAIMSTLTEDEQKREIAESVEYLEGIVGKGIVNSFCYPYGGFHSFNKLTEKLIIKQGCKFAFNVEWRDIDMNDLKNRPTALPRYDCNQFDFGTSTVGNRKT